MNNNNNGKGIFYGVIGVATLIVAIIGATFAYFTATASNENGITGNAATVALSVGVTKVTSVDEAKGLIPMSNSMVEAAVSYTGTEQAAEDGSKVCMDDNDNAVCQIYEITLTNKSSAGVFVDGYVALMNGIGTATDYVATTSNKTTMRWAQVFKNGNTYTTVGTPNLGSDADPTFTTLDLKTEQDNQGNTGMNKGNIKNQYSDVTKSVNIDGNAYDIIKDNYIRTSDHEFASPTELNPNESYDRETDITSALVYNQKIAGNAGDLETGVEEKYYIVVWLAETGTAQTAESGVGFFKGQVKFISATGGEVSATFSGVSRVPVQEG